MRCIYETKYRAGEDKNLNYLIEETEIGTPRLLFPSAGATDLYIEHLELKFWLIKAAGRDNTHRYTLEQLRAVKKILGPELSSGDNAEKNEETEGKRI